MESRFAIKLTRSDSLRLTGAGLVKQMEDWNYSSFKDYAGFRQGTLCNKELAAKFCLYNSSDFIEESHKQISTEILTALK